MIVNLLVFAGIIGIFIKELGTFKTALSYEEDEEEEKESHSKEYKEENEIAKKWEQIAC